MPKRQCEYNVRIKRRYLQHRKLTGRLTGGSLDREIAAINRFDEWNGYKDFKKFRIEQAVAFRDFLDTATNPKTGKPLGKSTTNVVLRALKNFFFWLSGEAGYRSVIRPSFAEYFNVTHRDKALARASEPRPAPTPEQARYVLSQMPNQTAIEKRNRALIGLLTLTGIRDGALITLRVKHIDLVERCVWQPPREVDTKFRKRITTYFTRGYDEAEEAVEEWVNYQRDALLRGNDAPLFPSTRNGTGENGGFVAVGLTHTAWTSASPVRRIVREAFESAGVEYFGPHAFRHMLAREVTMGGGSVEEVLAISQNIGHSDVLTTLRSYGQLGDDRVKALIRGQPN